MKGGSERMDERVENTHSGGWKREGLGGVRLMCAGCVMCCVNVLGEAVRIKIHDSLYHHLSNKIKTGGRKIVALSGGLQSSSC